MTDMASAPGVTVASGVFTRLRKLVVNIAVATLFLFVSGLGSYLWFSTNWAYDRIEATLFGQCVDVGGKAVGRVVWITPAFKRGGPYVKFNSEWSPVVHGRVKVAIGNTDGIYDAATLTPIACGDVK